MPDARDTLTADDWRLLRGLLAAHVLRMSAGLREHALTDAGRASYRAEIEHAAAVQRKLAPAAEACAA